MNSPQIEQIELSRSLPASSRERSRSIQVHELIINVDGGESGEETPLPEIVYIDPLLLKGKPMEYYSIVLQFGQAGRTQQCHLLSHTVVQYLNKHNDPKSDEWGIPLVLCQRYKTICRPPAFDLYQRSLEAYPEMLDIDLIRLWMRVRRDISQWMRFSRDYKSRHPLQSILFKYAAIQAMPNRVDAVVFHFLAHALQRVPAARTAWLKLEEELLGFKLMQRPELATQICSLTKTTPVTLETARAAIPKLLDLTVARIMERTDVFFNPKSKLARLAASFLRALVRLDWHQRVDAQAERAMEELRAQPSYLSPLQSGEAMPLSDIEENAPPCMQALLSEATGTVAQQASMPSERRRALIHYLQELGLEKQKLALVLRPKRMIEYELETPIQSFKTIEHVIQDVEQERAHNSNELSASYISCKSIMSAGLCSCQSPARYFEAKEQIRQEEWRQYVDAKTQCHTTLLNKHQQHKKRKLTHGKEVGFNSKRTQSPYTYTQVAIKGATADLE